MEDPNTLTPLKELDEKIAATRKQAISGAWQSGASAGASFGMKAGLDLVSGVAVGTGIGYALDQWLSTLPLFMLICMGIGTAAGIKLMAETAKRASAALEAEENVNKKE